MVDERPPRDKTPMQSKKFVAFLVAEVTWKMIIAIVMVMGMKDGDIDTMLGSVVLTCIALSGFIEALYIGGQAALDRYIEMAHIATSVGADVSMKHVKIGKPLEEEKDDRPDGENLR
jgi:hypothetical protein